MPNLPSAPRDQRNEFGITARPYHRANERWYHFHMIEWMITHPNGDLGDLAKHVGKARSTISAIVRSDMFQAALRARKAELAQQNDLVLTQKLTEVAVAGLDTILGVINKKKDNLPLETLNEVTDGALKRLGYGIEQKPGANVQVNVAGNAQIEVPISQSDLEEARLALRQHQQTRAAQSTPLPPMDAPSEAGAAADLGPLIEGVALSTDEEG